MHTALQNVGNTTLVGLACNAPETQRLRVVARLYPRLVTALRGRHFDHAVIELSGRALAEYWASWLLIASRQVAKVWVVVHDVPSIVGPTFLFAPLDRKGGRRIGMYLSDTIGAMIERRLLARVNGVITLSQAGADEFSRHHPEATVSAIPLPVTVDTPMNKPPEPTVYVPSRFDAPTACKVIEAAAQLDPPPTVTFGAASEHDRIALAKEAQEHGLDGRVKFLGHLEDDELDRAYDSATIVVRARRAKVNGNNRFAASGPVVSAMAAGCATITGDPRGSAECLADGRGLITSGDSQLVESLTELLQDTERAIEIGTRARQHVLDHHTPEAVGHAIEKLWQRERPT